MSRAALHTDLLQVEDAEATHFILVPMGCHDEFRRAITVEVCRTYGTTKAALPLS
jgi:hypothetical protein